MFNFVLNACYASGHGFVFLAGYCLFCAVSYPGHSRDIDITDEILLREVFYCMVTTLSLLGNWVPACVENYPYEPSSDKDILLLIIIILRLPDTQRSG